VPFIPIFWLFALFIFSCGFGHLVEASIFWRPWYRFSGVVKGVTAIVSWLTVIQLVKVLPGALALPGLAKVNRQLKDEITERERAEEKFRQLNADLEGRVVERTEALQRTNHQLEHKAQQLADRNVEVEQARRQLEEKAAELALISKYKSDFLANMSHELRTPLNSILILSQQLAENKPNSLMPQQIEFARNIYSSGADLLNLISDILDVAKIESGTVTIEAEALAFGTLRESIERGFRHVAEAKGLLFKVEFDSALPATCLTDPKRFIRF
jgi:signal transduction histidine kinase